MMPKGVEHNVPPMGVPPIVKVSLPMMPKGVEHTIIDSIPLSRSSGESSDDAERR